MKLPIEAITGFQRAWHMSFGEEISTEGAEMEGIQLLNTFSLILNKNEYEQHGKSQST
jgi:hypothetical protein